MGRRSGYDRTGLPPNAPGARRTSHPPGRPDHNSEAAPARQGAQPTSITGSETASETVGGSQGSSVPGLLTNSQQAPPASSRGNNNTPLPAGFVPAHQPDERRAPQEYDSAREYAAVETGRLPQQPRVPEGRSRLAQEVRLLDGPAEMPSVRAVPRVRAGGRGAASGAGPQPPFMQQPARTAASSSTIPPRRRASGVATQGSDQARAWARSEYVRRHPLTPVPSPHEFAALIREYEEAAAARAAGSSTALGTGTCFTFLQLAFNLFGLPFQSLPILLYACFGFSGVCWLLYRYWHSLLHPFLLVCSNSLTTHCFPLTASTITRFLQTSRFVPTASMPPI